MNRKTQQSRGDAPGATQPGFVQEHPYLSYGGLVGLATLAVLLYVKGARDAVLEKMDGNHKAATAAIDGLRSDTAKLEERVGDVKGVVWELASRETDADALTRRLTNDQSVITGMRQLRQGAYTEAIATLTAGPKGGDGWQVAAWASRDLAARLDDPELAEGERQKISAALDLARHRFPEKENAVWLYSPNKRPQD